MADTFPREISKHNLKVDIENSKEEELRPSKIEVKPMGDVELQSGDKLDSNSAADEESMALEDRSTTQRRKQGLTRQRSMMRRTTLHAMHVKQFVDKHRGRGNQDYFGPKGQTWQYIVSSLLWTGIGASIVIGAIVYYDGWSDVTHYDFLVYGLTIAFLANTAIWLDYLDDNFYGWKTFQVNFETVCGHDGKTIWFAVFILCSVIWWLVSSVRGEDINPFSNETADYIIYISFYCACVFFVFAFLASWELMSYYASTSEWIQSFLYLTIIGGIALENARWLRPPRDDEHTHSWHKRNDVNDYISGLFLVMNLGFLGSITVGILVPVLAEVSDWASSQNAFLAFLLFTIVAFSMLLHPLAPGTGIDVLGGFFFTFVFTVKYEMEFIETYFLLVAILISFHYAGACIQWWLGKMPFIQMWLNSILPTVLLASSDATLVEAGWFEVGIIGFFWLDTLNGFNQGRINMEFWTQLLSEWTCLPNAFCFGAFGAAIAAGGLEQLSSHSWTQTAVPLFIIAGSGFSYAGLFWALTVMGSKMSNKTFWNSREKWESKRYWEKQGFVATKKGWEDIDIFQLRSQGESWKGDEDKGLFAKIYPLQLRFVIESELAETQKDKLELVDKFEIDCNAIRQAHFQEMEPHLQDYVAHGFMTNIPAATKPSTYWDDVDERPFKRKLQIAIVFSLILAFWVMITGLFMGVAIDVAVEEKTEALKDVSSLTWFGLAWFMIVYNAYWIQTTIHDIKGLWGGIIYLFKCCPMANADMETTFATPEWTVPKDLEQATLTKLVEEFKDKAFLIDPIENTENENIITTIGSAKLMRKKTKEAENSKPR